MNFERELDKIAAEFEYMDDRMIWEALQTGWHMNNLDEETKLLYAKDAAQSARRVRYDVPYDEIIRILISEYEALQKKYGFTDDNISQAVYYVIQSFLNGRIEVSHKIMVNEGWPDDDPELPENDIDNHRMACIFANLPPQPEVADYLAKIDVNYIYEHLNMVNKFSSQSRFGFKCGFKKEHIFSARTTYNNMFEPYSLLWIAAVLGENPEIVKNAADEAEKMKTKPEKSKTVRRFIPFGRIHELAIRMEAEEWEDDI